MSREHALAVVSSTPLLFGTVKMGTDYLFYSIIYTLLKGSSIMYSVKYVRELSHIWSLHTVLHKVLKEKSF